MEFKQVKEVSPIEEKSTQEVEQNLLDKHEESLKVSDVNENVSETSNTVKETTIEENKAEQDIADLPEIKDEDVLSYIKERYNKDISSVDELFSEQEKNSPLPDEVSKYLDLKKKQVEDLKILLKPIKAMII